MKTKDRNQFVIFVFCFIRNKKYENRKFVSLKKDENSFVLYLNKDYYQDDEYFYITEREAKVITKLKQKYENNAI